jgi:hypothetical protein
MSNAIMTVADLVEGFRDASHPQAKYFCERPYSETYALWIEFYSKHIILLLKMR